MTPGDHQGRRRRWRRSRRVPKGDALGERLALLTEDLLKQTANGDRISTSTGLLRAARLLAVLEPTELPVLLAAVPPRTSGPWVERTQSWAREYGR